uniref:Permease n=1 Tax=Solibacter usitatus (strain Ellin6076) TaxID=234267 RepID=Q01T25_SOLUE
MRNVLQDLRYAMRVLRRTPALTAVAVLTLALGIAATTTVFGWIDGMVVHPFHGARDDGQLAVLESVSANGMQNQVSYADFRDFQDSLHSVSGLLLNQKGPASIGEGEKADIVWYEGVSGNYFDVLGVKPVLGRAFTRDEYGDRAKAFTAVISYRLWKSYFHADKSVLGRTVQINRYPVTIVGVAPPEFGGDFPGMALDIWVPAPLTGERERDARHFHAIVRLKPGVRVSEANAEAATVAARLARGFPKTNRGIGARMVPIWKAKDWGASSIVAWPLAILGAACVLVLLIACANVANLLLARSAARQTEFGIRAALGGSPGRLSRQLILESLLLAALATLAGLPLALSLENVLTYFVPPTGVPVNFNVQPSARVFLFAALACLVSALISGIPPAFQLVQRSLVDALKQGGRSGTRSAHAQRVSGVLVVAETGLALAALVTLGLFVRSLYGLENTPAGFDHQNVTVSRLFLSTNNYTASEEQEFSRRLREHLLAAPGVTSAAYSDSIPLGFGLGKWASVVVEGYASRPGENLDVDLASVSPGYFDLLRIPLLAGRDFRAEDNGTAPRVTIVNEAFARRFFDGRDPVGHRVRVYGKPFQIVGMVKDSKYYNLPEAPQPYFYMSFDQVHYGSGETGVAFYARTDRDARDLVPVLRREMSAIDPKSAGLTTMPLSDYISAAWFGSRIASSFLAVLGAISMLLAGVGLYGVMAYSVSQRTREIGIRMALGAEPGGVLRIVMREGLLLALLGIAAGLAIALAATPQIAPLLYQVSPADPVSIAGAALFLIVVAVLASLIPALRATRVDPIRALRQE